MKPILADVNVWLATLVAEHPHHEGAGLDKHLANLCTRRGSSPSFWSDAYLAAFALAGRHRVATFDRGFRRFEDLHLILLTDSGDARTARA